MAPLFTGLKFGFGSGAGEEVFPDILPDSYAANLYLALPLTNYKSSLTGGTYVDVAPLVKGSGSAKVATQTGNTSISSAVASPFTQYTDSMLWGTTTTTSDVFYYSLQLGSNQQLTIEFWLYHLASRDNSYGFIQTNNFGGGGYPAWVWGTNYLDFDGLNYFTNSAPAGHRPSSGASLNLDDWSHVAMCCNGTDNLKMFINGTQVYNGAYGPNAGQSIFTIGSSAWDGIPSLQNERFQDFRIYTGVQKYTGSFTVNKDNPDFGGRILG
jgi:hypothetical protein